LQTVIISSFQRFQSTRPRGARLKLGKETMTQAVSIHAPAGGATYRAKWLIIGYGFNPRARGGRDAICHLNPI